MGKTFGNTWWGEQWLNALSHIDYDNRIPRGMSYARKGMVKDIKLKGNVITAKVSGSRPRPYSVTIVIPPFFPEEVDRLMDRLLTRPGIISGLLARKLDPEIMEIAASCGLKLFPEKWTDFKMLCNCPDWAVPCKHLASVVYMFSREIDNNPFIVFEMHNVFLLDELKKRGIEVSEVEKKASVPELRDIVRVKPAKEAVIISPDFKRVDFSRLENRLEVSRMFLQDSPSFDISCNFKEAYIAEVIRISKNAARFFSGKLSPETFSPEISCIGIIDQDTEIRLSFDASLNWQLESVSRNGDDDAVLTADTLVPALLHIDPDFIQDYHPTVIAAYQALLFSLHLLSAASAVPELLSLSDRKYAIRWLPDGTGRCMEEMLTQFDGIVPDGMIRFKTGTRSAGKYIYGKSMWLASFFLGQAVRCLSASCSSNPIMQMFFKGLHLSFAGVGEKEIPGGILAWTSVFKLGESFYRPVLVVNENPDGGFDLDVSVEDTRVSDPMTIPIIIVLQDKKYEKERFDILRSLTLVSNIIEDINTYINDGAEQPLHYTEKTFLPFLLKAVPAARMLDIKVFLPKSLRELIRPKPSLSIGRKSDVGRGFLRIDDLLSFDWEVALGDISLSVAEFRKLMGKAEGLIKFKQSYICADAEDLQKLHDVFESGDRMTPARLLQIALLEEYENAPVRLSNEVKDLIRKLTAMEDVPVPTKLNAKLRPYQERGYAWMYRNMRIGFGSILADDMGLGKTLQAITLMLKLREERIIPDRPALVVVPTGLLTNWQAEINRFAPTLKTFVYHGNNRSVKDFRHDILITTYGVVRSDCAKLKKINWSVMFIDEAQNIKNHNTAQSKAVCTIPADVHIALSGTPVENRLSEFWSIMEYANKGYLDSLKSFKEKYAKPIQLYNDLDCAERFRKVTAPFMMRRLKTDKTIINDLPDKIEQNEFASLKSSQAALYSSTLEMAMKEIEGIESVDSQSLFKRQGLILQMILALKQICNHPAQFLKNGDVRLELSGKAEMLVDLVESIVESGEKVLVFTQFREMGDILVKLIEERLGMSPMFYHGGCSIKARQDMVDRFQNARADKVFILSLKAAGTGLNLTAASHVIHYDLWWNPAVEAQATDRAYRIGQTQNVMVHRFITKDTFEERIDAMIRQKKHLADMTVASGENWIGKLSNEELREIFG